MSFAFGFSSLQWVHRNKTQSAQRGQFDAEVRPPPRHGLVVFVVVVALSVTFAAAVVDPSHKNSVATFRMTKRRVTEARNCIALHRQGLFLNVNIPMKHFTANNR